ncbi:hypothetical protein FSP39_024345 [Pinctada imbricata]|uniref:Uncharacterized protein n=1 Tax=Pinctada imbricata TaxID=66713 RepID=A0AA89CAB7_PINIB|nr:hypothetical protein FSP39_024345 [Pinctada imbricata]
MAQKKGTQNNADSHGDIQGHEQWVMRTRKISFIVILVGFICYLVSVLTPYWIAYTDKGYSMNLGIFFTCIGMDGKTTCGTSGGRTEGLLRAAQVFSPFALLTIFTATCCGLMVFFWPEVHRRRILRVACVTSFVSAVLILLTIALYCAHYKDKASKLHAAFFVCLVGLVCSPIAGVLFLQDSMTMIIVEVRKLEENSGYGDQNRLIAAEDEEDSSPKKKFTDFGHENGGFKPPLMSFVQHPPAAGYQPVFKGDRLLKKKMERDEAYKRPVSQ